VQSGIQVAMRWRWVLVCLVLLLWTSPKLLTVSAGTPGTFRGTVVRSPQASDSAWVYLLGRNGLARRVNVSQSEVAYGKSVPQRDRKKIARESLVPGADLRVTAEQDRDGNWRAIYVEVLSLGASQEQSRKP
jgi:hypothetical protein